MAFKTAFETGSTLAWESVKHSHMTYAQVIELAHQKNPYKSETKRTEYIDGVKDMLTIFVNHGTIEGPVQHTDNYRFEVRTHDDGYIMDGFNYTGMTDEEYKKEVTSLTGDIMCGQTVACDIHIFVSDGTFEDDMTCIDVITVTPLPSPTNDTRIGEEYPSTIDAYPDDDYSLPPVEIDPEGDYTPIPVEIDPEEAETETLQKMLADIDEVLPIPEVVVPYKKPDVCSYCGHTLSSNWWDTLESHALTGCAIVKGKKTADTPTSPTSPEETGKQYAMERIPSAGSFEALCHIYETARDNNPYSRLEDQSHFLIGVHRTLEAEIDRQYPESPEDLPQVSPVKKTEKEYTVYFDHQIVGTIHSTGYLSAANSAMLNIGVTEVELLTVERGDKRVTYHNVLIDADNDITYEWKDVDHSAHPDTPNTPEVEPDVKEVFCRHEAVDNVKARLQKMNAHIYHTEIVDTRTTGIAYYTSLCALSPQHTYKKGQKVMLSGLTPEVYGVILETYPNFEQSGETAYAVQLEESRHAHGGLETEVDVFSHHLLTSVEGTKL